MRKSQNSSGPHRPLCAGFEWIKLHFAVCPAALTCRCFSSEKTAIVFCNTLCGRSGILVLQACLEFPDSCLHIIAVLPIRSFCMPLKFIAAKCTVIIGNINRVSTFFADFNRWLVTVKTIGRTCFIINPTGTFAFHE